MTEEAPEIKVTMTPSTNEATSSGGENPAEKDTHFPSRFPLWYALTVFSAVSLIALCTETNTSEWFAEEKWVLSVTLMSLLLSCIACMAHIAMRENFVGKPLEGLLLFTELGFWVGGLIVMMDTEHMLAVDATGSILNANLYFFSWSSLVATVSLLVGYGHQVNDAIMASGNVHSAGYWAGICVASLVAMISSVQIYVKGETIEGLDFDCQGGSDDHGSGYCERLNFSIALGVISTIVSGICSLFAFKMSNVVNGSVSFVMLFSWTLGVAFVTFGEKSPGNRVGNLYFGCWAAFVMSLFMVSTSVKNFLATREGSSETDDKPDFRDAVKPEEAPSAPEDEAETASPSDGILSPTSTVPDTDPTFDSAAAPVASVDVPSQV